MINVKVNPENHGRQRNKTSNNLFQCIINIKPQEVQYTQYQCLYGGLPMSLLQSWGVA